MSTAARVSVVMATFNAAATLEDSLASVLAQTVPLELVVVDGASSDGTLQILQQQAGRIARLVSEPDRGVYDALNKGVALAGGEYVYVLGGDDQLAHPGALAQLLAAADGADVVHGEALLQDARGAVHAAPALPLWRFPLQMPFSHQAVLVRREWLLRFPFGASLASDYRHLYQLYLAGARFRRVPACVAVCGPGGLSDRHQVASTWDRLRINFELRGWRALGVLPFYLAQAAVCWIKPPLVRALTRQARRPAGSR